MTNLTEKFDQLEQITGDRHTEMMSTLNALLTALGAPPPGPSTTLLDVVNVLNVIKTNTETAATRLGLIRQENQDFYDDTLNWRSFVSGKLNSIDSKLSQLATNTDLIINNNSANTQMLLAALATLDPCKDCSSSIGEKPSPDIGTSPQDQEQCKRAQFLLACIKRLVDKFDQLITSGIYPTPANIFDAVKSLEGTLSLPNIILPSYLEASRMIAMLANLAVQRLLHTEDLYLADAIDILYDELLAALYAASSAEAGLAAYESVIGGSNLSAVIKNVLISAGYVALFNYCYDRLNSIELSGIDGTICAPVEPPPTCIDVAGSVSTTVTFTGDNSVHVQLSADLSAFQLPMLGSVVIPGGTVTFNPPVVAQVDAVGWTVQLLSGTFAHVAWLNQSGGVGGATLSTVGQIVTINEGTQTLLVDNWDGDSAGSGPFEVRVCRAIA